jgi:hypothetical protein
MIFQPLPTLLLRMTLNRVGRLVLPAWAPIAGSPYESFPSPPPGAYRMVQVLTERSIYIDYELASANGRDYEMMHVPGSTGVVAPFPVMADQELYALSAFNPGVNEASLVRASLIVQHWVPLSEAKS